MCTKYLLKNKNIDHLSLKKKNGYAFFFGNYLSNTLQHNIFCSIVLFYRLQLRGHHEKEKKSNKICTITYILLQLLRLWQFYYNYNTITILFTFSTIKMFQKRFKKISQSKISKVLAQGSKGPSLKDQKLPIPQDQESSKKFFNQEIFTRLQIFFSVKKE